MRWSAAVVLLAFQSVFADDRAVVSWEALAQVTVVKQKDRYVPEFSKQIAALDNREVKLRDHAAARPGAAAEAFSAEPQPPSASTACLAPPNSSPRCWCALR